MTTPTINGRRPNVTDGGGVRVRACATETGPQASDPARSGWKSVCTRAIPRLRRTGKGADATSRTSPHVTAARDAAAGSWLLTERPASLVEAVKSVPPPAGTTRNPALWVALTVVGLFRLAVVTAAYLAIFAVWHPDARPHRIRATATLTVVCAVAVAHLVARNLT